MKLPAWFFIIVAILMVGQWGFFMATGAVPELWTEPWRIGFHLAAELATAASLLAGGVGLLRDRPWGKAAGLFAAGLLAYTCIVSPGYFAQLGQWPLVGMFAVLLVLDVLNALTLLRPARANS
jgi:hypothetical protein